MTGFYIRVQRDGKWQAVEIDCLTEAELDAFAASQPDRGWFWVRGLLKWIRDCVAEKQ